MTGLSATGSGRGSIAPTLASDKFSVRVGLRSEQGREHRWIDVGCVVVLCIAVLVQGLVELFGLPARLELVGDLAVAVLAGWTAIVVLRSGNAITVPYLVMAIATVLVIAALRADDLVRLGVSARHFLLLPLFALCLAALRPSERRIRMVIVTVIGLVGIEFVITIVQALTVSDVDFVIGTFGGNAGFNAALVFLAASCLALGVYASGAGGSWWLLVASVLPLYSIWGAVRAVFVVLPLMSLAVAVTAWRVRAASADQRERWRQPLLILGVLVLLPTVIIFAGFALTRPSDLSLFTNAGAIGEYLDNTGVLTARQDRVGRPINAVPASLDSDSERAFAVRPAQGASYAGVLFDAAPPLRPGGTYSFRVAVRPSVAGSYQLYAGVYGKAGNVTDPIELPAGRWTKMQLDVTTKARGPAFLTLRKSTGTYAGTESIAFDCSTAGGVPCVAPDDYLHNTVNAVPVSLDSDSDQAFSVRPTKGAKYAGALFDEAPPLRPGGSYSFGVAVRPSVSGRYQLYAGVYRQVGSVTDPIKLPADRWTRMQLDVTTKAKGPAFLALRKSTGTYAGTESIAFDCSTADGTRCVYLYRQRAGAAATTTEALRGSGPVIVPGHLSQITTAIKLVGDDPLDFLFGMGLGASSYAQNLGVDPPPRRQYIAGQNDFGTLLVELGWVGVALVLVGGAVLAAGSLAGARRAPAGTWTRALLIAYPGVLVALGVAMLFATPFRNIASATTFWLLTGLVLGVLFAQSRSDDGQGAVVPDAGKA